jgi:3-deoxy-7-phosphoheptulonate synthase
MNKINYNDIYQEFVESRVIIAGPCAVEYEEQINTIAKNISELGVKYFRAGAFKPRTSCSTFQGLGLIGQQYIRQAADKYNLLVVSEILDSSHIEECYDLIDIIQIGSRNMAAYTLLKNIGKATSKDKKPVLLKRGFNATLNEMLSAAEYIMNEGNPNVILCLRGIRTYEQIDSDMRFTPDLGAILELKEKTNLPIIFDPSHAAGDAKFVVKLAEAALFLGANGLLIETHNEPEKAFTDGKQSIKPEILKSIIEYKDSL